MKRINCNRANKMSAKLYGTFALVVKLKMFNFFSGKPTEISQPNLN